MSKVYVVVLLLQVPE